MKNYAFYVFIAIFIGWVSAGCTPTLIGSPENSGLILVEGKITMLRTHSIDNAIIQIRNPTERRWESIAPNKGKQFGKYILFDNLDPGNYRLRRVSSYVGEGGWSTLSINFRRTTRYVNAGQPVYIGKIIINWNLENKTKWESDIEYEIASWKYFLKEYRDSVWTDAIRARLDDLSDRSQKSALTPRQRRRLMGYLLRMARDNIRNGNTAIITPSPAPDDIAIQAAIPNKELVKQALDDLSRRGIIEQSDEGLIIPDVDKLAALVF